MNRGLGYRGKVGVTVTDMLNVVVLSLGIMDIIVFTASWQCDRFRGLHWH